MNLYSKSRSNARFYAFSTVIATILVFASVSAALGQGRSEDRDNPAPLFSNKVNDDLDGSDSQYFYKFTAGPGKITVTFEVKASGTNAGAMLDLFANSKAILSDILAQGVDGGSERQVNSVQLNTKREIVMRIKGLKYGDSGGTGAYTITLDGPITFAQAPAPAAPGAPAPAAGGAVAPAGSNLASGQLDPNDNRRLFHFVNVNGPGPVTFSFSVKATDAKAGARFGVLTENGTLALPAVEVQGGDSISKAVTFDKPQTLTILLEVMKFPDNGGGHGTYSIQVSGPATVIK